MADDTLTTEDPTVTPATTPTPPSSEGEVLGAVPWDVVASLPEFTDASAGDRMKTFNRWADSHAEVNKDNLPEGFQDWRNGMARDITQSGVGALATAGTTFLEKTHELANDTLASVAWAGEESAKQLAGYLDWNASLFSANLKPLGEVFKGAAGAARGAQEFLGNTREAFSDINEEYNKFMDQYKNPYTVQSKGVAGYLATDIVGALPGIGAGIIAAGTGGLPLLAGQIASAEAAKNYTDTRRRLDEDPRFAGMTDEQKHFKAASFATLTTGIDTAVNVIGAHYLDTAFGMALRGGIGNRIAATLTGSEALTKALAEGGSAETKAIIGMGENSASPNILKNIFSAHTVTSTISQTAIAESSVLGNIAVTEALGLQDPNRDYSREFNDAWKSAAVLGFLTLPLIHTATGMDNARTKAALVKDANAYLDGSHPFLNDGLQKYADENVHSDDPAQRQVWVQNQQEHLVDRANWQKRTLGEKEGVDNDRADRYAATLLSDIEAQKAADAVESQHPALLAEAKAAVAQGEQSAKEIDEAFGKAAGDSHRAAVNATATDKLNAAMAALHTPETDAAIEDAKAKQTIARLMPKSYVEVASPKYTPEDRQVIATAAKGLVLDGGDPSTTTPEEILTSAETPKPVKVKAAKAKKAPAADKVAVAEKALAEPTPAPAAKVERTALTADESKALKAERAQLQKLDDAGKLPAEGIARSQTIDAQLMTAEEFKKTYGIDPPKGAVVAPSKLEKTPVVKPKVEQPAKIQAAEPVVPKAEQFKRNKFSVWLSEQTDSAKLRELRDEHLDEGNVWEVKVINDQLDKLGKRTVEPVVDKAVEPAKAVEPVVDKAVEPIPPVAEPVPPVAEPVAPPIVEETNITSKYDRKGSFHTITNTTTGESVHIKREGGSYREFDPATEKTSGGVGRTLAEAIQNAGKLLQGDRTESSNKGAAPTTEGAVEVKQKAPPAPVLSRAIGNGLLTEAMWVDAGLADLTNKGESPEDAKARLEPTLRKIYGRVRQFFVANGITDATKLDTAIDQAFLGTPSKRTVNGVATKNTKSIRDALKENFKKTGDPFKVSAKVAWDSESVTKNVLRRIFTEAARNPEANPDALEQSSPKGKGPSDGDIENATGGPSEVVLPGDGPVDGVDDGAPSSGSIVADIRMDASIAANNALTDHIVSKLLPKVKGLEAMSPAEIRSQARAAFLEELQRRFPALDVPNLTSLGFTAPPGGVMGPVKKVIAANFTELFKKFGAEARTQLEAGLEAAREAGLLKDDHLNSPAQAGEAKGMEWFGALAHTQLIADHNAETVSKIASSGDVAKITSELNAQAEKLNNRVAIHTLLARNGVGILDGTKPTDLTQEQLDAMEADENFPQPMRELLQGMRDAYTKSTRGPVDLSTPESALRLILKEMSKGGNVSPVLLNWALPDQGAWKIGSNVVQINPLQMTSERLLLSTVLHEKAHPMLYAKIDAFERGNYDQLTQKEQDVIRDIKTLFNTAQVEAAVKLAEAQEKLSSGEIDQMAFDKIDRDLRPGTSDIREFFNEALNQKGFQDFLSNIKDENFSGKTGIFRTLLNKFLTLLTGKPVAADSLLQRVFESHLELLRKERVENGPMEMADQNQFFKAHDPQGRGMEALMAEDYAQFKILAEDYAAAGRHWRSDDSLPMMERVTAAAKDLSPAELEQLARLQGHDPEVSSVLAKNLSTTSLHSLAQARVNENGGGVVKAAEPIRIDPNEILKNYRERKYGTTRPTISERVSQEAFGGSDGGNLREALSVGERSLSPIRKTDAQRQRAAAHAAEQTAYRAWAKAKGLIIPQAEFDAKWKAQGSKGESEHQVYFDQADERWHKRNLLNFHDDSISAYLERLAIQKFLFPEMAPTFEGFTTFEGKLFPVISQPHAVGETPTDGQIRQHLLDMGFVEVFDTGKMTKLQQLAREAGLNPPGLEEAKRVGFLLKSEGIWLEDVHDENAVLSPNGKLNVFDPVAYFVDATKLDSKLIYPKAEVGARTSMASKAQPENAAYKALTEGTAAPDAPMSVQSVRRTTGELRRDRMADVWEMYKKSYEKIGMQFSAPEQLLKHAVWDVSHNAEGTADSFFMFKRTSEGLKITAAGTDGSLEGKAALQKSLEEYLNTPGYYGEFSGGLEKMAIRLGFTPLPVDQVATLLGKEIAPQADGFHYERSINGLNEPHIKAVYGTPQWNTLTQESTQTSKNLNDGLTTPAPLEPSEPTSKMNSTPSPSEELTLEKSPTQTLSALSSKAQPAAPRTFEPSVFGPEQRKLTEAMSRIREGLPEVQRALTDKTYFAWTERETADKANDYLDLEHKGDIYRAFTAARSDSRIPAEQQVMVQGIALKRLTNARAALTAAMEGDPKLASSAMTLRDHYTDVIKQFSHEIADNASLAGQNLRAYRMLADMFVPQSWSALYTTPATKAQAALLGDSKTKVGKAAGIIKSELQGARDEARGNMAARLQKVFEAAARRFMPTDATAAEIEARKELAAQANSPLPEQHSIIQAATDAATLEVMANIRKGVTDPTPEQSDWLKEVEQRIRAEAADQINRHVDEVLKGGKVDEPAPTGLTPEQIKDRKTQQISDLWKRLAENPLSKAVFEQVKQTITTEDHPYAEIMKGATFDDVRSDGIRKAVLNSVLMREEISKSVEDRNITAEGLRLKVQEMNPTLSKEQAAKIGDAVEAVYNEEVQKAATAAMERMIARAESKEVTETLDRPTINKLLPLVNMGAFKDERFYNALAEKHNLPSWDPEVAAKIEADAEKVQSLPEGSLQRGEAAQVLALDILRAHINDSKGWQRVRHINKIATSLWTAGIISGPPSRLVDTFATAASVFIESMADASGQYIKARKGGKGHAEAKGFFTDSFRAWGYSFGKDASGTTNRALAEAFSALTKGTTRFKSEKEENFSPLELFKFDDTVAIPGNAMMDAIASKSWKSLPKLGADLLGGIAKNTAERIVKVDAKGAAKDWAATMRLVGRAMLVADTINQTTAASAKELMVRRAIEMEKGERSPAEIDALMKKIAQGGEDDIVSEAKSTVEDEAAKGQFGDKGTAAHKFAKSRRLDQIIEQNTFGPEITDKGRSFAEMAAFNNEPYGLVGAVTMETFGRLNSMFGLAPKAVVPFPKILSNLVNASLSWGPVGSLRAEGYSLSKMLPRAYEQYHTATPEHGSAEYWGAHVKAAAGTAALVLMGGLAMKAFQTRQDGEEPWFEIYGPGPTDPKMRGQWKSAGGRPFSIKAGNTYLRYTDWPALSIVLGAIGSTYDRYRWSNEEVDFQQKLFTTVLSVAGVTLDRNMLGGTSDVFKILSSDTPEESQLNSVKQFAGSYISGFTKPQAIRWVEQLATETYPERKTTSGWLLSLLPIAPVIRNQNSYNILGEDINIPKTDTAFGRFVAVKQDHPILTPLTNAGVFLNPPKRFMLGDSTKQTGARKMTAAEFYDYGRAYGDNLKALLSPSQVASLSSLAARDQQAAQNAADTLCRIATTQAQDSMQREWTLQKTRPKPLSVH